MIKGFRNFVMRGNIVEAAVAFVVALAFSALIAQFINYVINPAAGRDGLRPQDRACAG